MNRFLSVWPAAWSREQRSSATIAAASVALVLILWLIALPLGWAPEPIGSNAQYFAEGTRVTVELTLVAGLSGVLLGMTQGFDFQVGFKILLLVFAAVVLGGLGTIYGAILGAFIIGIFVEVSTLVIPAELKFVGALVVLILVLLVRPTGLLGKAERVG